MSALDRTELVTLLLDALHGTTVPAVPLADRILALVGPVEPVAFTRDRVRTELAASLPADPKWVAWVDGVLDRLEATS